MLLLRSTVLHTRVFESNDESKMKKEKKIFLKNFIFILLSLVINSEVNNCYIHAYPD